MTSGANEASAAIKKVETDSNNAASAGKKRDSEASAALKKRQAEEDKIAALVNLDTLGVVEQQQLMVIINPQHGPAAG